MNMIEEALEESIAWAVFEPNNARLRQTLVHSIGEFLGLLFEGGALAGGRREDAFFIRAGDDLNPPAAADRGELLIEVGVAISQPAEFVVLRVGRTGDALEISE
jgi:phage tail sheath protein FI